MKENLNQWNLEEIYPSDESWDLALTQIKNQTDELEGFKGKLGDSAQSLYFFLEKHSNFYKEFTRVYCYANLKSDQDTRVSKYLAKLQEISQAEALIGGKLSYIQPEILALGKDKVDQFITEYEPLKIYNMFFDNLFRSKDHLLSASEEKLMAQASVILGSPSSIHTIFTNAEFPYPTITLSDNSTVILDQSGYSKYRAVENRNDREKVYQAFWKEMEKFQKTLAQQLFSQINADIFIAQSRKFKTSLESALHEFNVPVEVYHSLIENVNNNLGAFHRYLSLRKRILGLDILKYSDMYAPVVKNLDNHYSFEQAHDLVVKSMEPLGKKIKTFLI